MVSPLPWRLDENDPSIIYDANNEVIAKNYKFIHVDDFEAICRLIVKNCIKKISTKTGKTSVVLPV